MGPRTGNAERLAFEGHDVHGLLSVAHLFPRSKGRTGIYFLEFADGTGYVGKSVDVVGRWASHRRRWQDMVRLEFVRLPLERLDRTERSQIQARQSAGTVLRNVTYGLGDPQAESDLDWLVEPSDQFTWLNEDLWILDDVDDRVEDLLLRDAKRPMYERLVSRPDFDGIEFTLQAYTQLCVPRPRATELTFWALSAMPSTNRSVAPRLAAMSINKMETIVLGHLKDEPDQVWSFVNVSHSDLLAAGDTLENLLNRTPGASSDGQGRYESSGHDAVSIHFEHLGVLVTALLEQPTLLHAARALNLRLMRKGPTFQWRGHCFDLADHVIVELPDEEEEPGAAGAGNRISATPVDAPRSSEPSTAGWVSTRNTSDTRPPRIVHASRECIERTRNPHTGLAVRARPATSEEAQRARPCHRCL